MATPGRTAASDGDAKQTVESGTSQVEPHQEELKNLNYELLLLGFSLLSVFNIAVFVVARDRVIIGVVDIINVPLTAIFFVDFLIRLRSAESKRRYFFRQFGWADLAASLPFPAFKILRLFR